MEEDKPIVPVPDTATNNIQAIPVKKPEATEKESGLFIVVDSSVLFAYVHSKDSNHVVVESALGAIKPYKPHICIPHIVLLEVMGKLIRESGYTVANAQKILEKSMQEFDTRYQQTRVSYKIIIDRYKEYAKTDVSRLKGADFYIVVEAITLGAILLTCDKEMQEKAKSKHKKIFLLGSKKSELSKLIKIVEKTK